MKLFWISLVSLLASALASCGLVSQPADIITTVFAHYDLTRSLIKDTNLTVQFPVTPGQDVHDWQPTAQDIQSFYDASLIILNGLDLEPWSENLLSQPELDAEVLILDEYVELLEGHDHEDHARWIEPLLSEEDEVYDPHYWLDPHNATLIVAAIEDKLVTLFPDEIAVINANAVALSNDLETLETAYAALLEDNHHEEDPSDVHDHETLVFAGHNAFGYWMNYGIEFITPYEDFSVSTSPTASQISALTSLLESMEEPIIFASLLEGLAIAELLSDQIPNLEIEYLSTLENVKSNEMETLTYLSLMTQNLEALEKALHHDSV